MLRPLSACLAALVVACASPAPATLTPAPAAGVSALAPGAALSPAQRAWVDRTLASLSLRERAGQMVMVWVLGDYTNADDSTFAEVRRWIVNDGIGGVSMSLGTPIEVAAKLEAFQKLARVPLLASSDLEPALGRLEGAVFSHYLMESGGATVFPTAMAIAATGRDQDAYDVGQIIGREARAVGIHVNFAPPSTSTTTRRTRSSTRARSAKMPRAWRACRRCSCKGRRRRGPWPPPSTSPGMATPTSIRTPGSPWSRRTGRAFARWSSSPSVPRSTPGRRSSCRRTSPSPRSRVTPPRRRRLPRAS
ncbi:MAG: hypothetical protein IPP20_04640 [Gemmatimonadetes bacterium]|nr:hypothetical protein [Gemmatimonadota bacterium]